MKCSSCINVESRCIRCGEPMRKESIFFESFEEPCNKHTRTSIWPWIVFAIFAFMVTSCKSLTVEESEWRRGIDKENWAACEQAYSASGVSTEHSNHTHGRTHKPPNSFDIRDDLARNYCKSILRDRWAEYHYD